MTGGWIKDNGIRFRKWAELVVLLRAIAEGWQPIIDIFSNADKQCAVCHNERYNANEWKYQLISAILPKLPIIQFPRWPRIVLDLTDIRMGIVIRVPDFQFNVSPLHLPDLPNLSLPNAPTLGISLPSITVLPHLPPLPDLPDLPSFPKITLPPLPPPPNPPEAPANAGAAEVSAPRTILENCSVMPDLIFHPYKF